MPIKVKDYQWSETDANVHVVVPLKGVKAAKADIYSTDVYIKVNYPPFLFEADLCNSIDDSASSATVTNKGTIEFKLIKREPGLWGQLLAENASDKDAMFERRTEAQERSFKSQEDAKKAKIKQQTESQRAAVQAQLAVDRAETQKLTDLKDAEKAAANEEIAKVAANDTTANKSAATPSKGKEKVESKAPVRKSGQIKVSFTRRHFASAARESHAAEEEEWLAKQMAAKKAVEEAKAKAAEGGIEADPLWYKDKGNGFFKEKNYQSAINAYSAGIALDNQMAALFSNRAACHLAQNDFYAAGNDCSKAISLLTPPVEANKKSRLVAHSRRAAALSGVGDFDSAATDLREALRLNPDNASLQEDLRVVMTKLNAG